MTEQGLAAWDIVVRYGATTAVDGVRLSLDPGQIVALLGPSGCGKSSLLRAIAGLEPLGGGQVLWDGRDLSGVPVHRRGFGLMFQDGQLFAHRNVAGNVAYGLGGRRRRGQSRDERVAEMLAMVGLAGFEEREVATLSGGERQRVALARALAPRPRLLLLDEPLSALDRGLRERLAADLRAVLVGTGTTAVFVTHDHDEAFAVADKVAVMDRGRVLQVAPPQELWRAPGTSTVAKFLGYQGFIRAVDIPGAEGLAPDALVAIGPRALRIDPKSPVGWWGTVESTAFRRGATEVTVAIELPVRVGREGRVTQREGGTAGDAATDEYVYVGGGNSADSCWHWVAIAADGAARWPIGARVWLAVDLADCAIIGGNGRVDAVGD